VEALVLCDGQPRLAYFDQSGVLTLATGDGEMRKRIALDPLPRVAVQLGDSIVVGTGTEVRSFQISHLVSSSVSPSSERM
jgi:hypothetical protein